MTKLSKQDKSDIYDNWKCHGKSSLQLGEEYGVSSGNLRYLPNLVDKYGLEIIDRPYTHYSIEFQISKKRSLK